MHEINDRGVFLGDFGPSGYTLTSDLLSASHPIPMGNKARDTISKRET